MGKNNYGGLIQEYTEKWAKHIETYSDPDTQPYIDRYQDELGRLTLNDKGMLFQASSKATRYLRPMIQEISHFDMLSTFQRVREEAVSAPRLKAWCPSLKRLIEDAAEWRGKIDTNSSLTIAEFAKDLPVSLVRTAALFYDVGMRMIKSSIPTGMSQIEHLIHLSTGDLLMSNANVIRLMRSLWTLGDYLKWGKRRFKLSRGLALYLWNTDLPRHWKELIRCPFPAFCIETPGTAPEFNAEMNAINFVITTVYVQEGTEANTQQIYVTSHANGRDGFPLLADLGKLWEQDEDPETWGDYGITARMILNAMLYINSIEPNIVHKGKDKKANIIAKTPRQREKKDRVSSDDVFIVGPDIVLSPQQAETLIEGGADKSPRVGPKIRFPVRGFWRNQACGPGLKNRRPTWVKPYWKGPDTAAIVAREYSVKGDDRVEEKGSGEDEGEAKRS